MMLFRSRQYTALRRRRGLPALDPAASATADVDSNPYFVSPRRRYRGRHQPQKSSWIPSISSPPLKSSTKISSQRPGWWLQIALLVLWISSRIYYGHSEKFADFVRHISSHRQKQQRHQKNQAVSLLEPSVPLEDEDEEDEYEPDYGGLHIRSSDSNNFQRGISPLDDKRYEYYRHELLDEMSEEGHEWYAREDLELDEECASPAFAGDHFMNCNSFHEVDYIPSQLQADMSMKILNNGFYRDAWLVEGDPMRNFVVKRTRLNDDRDFDYEDYVNTDKDALIMERFSSSSRIMDIYGYCGASVAVESMVETIQEAVTLKGGLIHPLDDYSEEELLHLPIQNDLEPRHKLQLALEMAEAVAYLHGHEEGAIMHVDISSSQFMLNSEGQIKLGDFNRAEIMEWHREENHFCTMEFGEVYGVRRSPEEVAMRSVQEGIDVYALGNVFYQVLTGMSPFYELIALGKDVNMIMVMIVDGLVPLINSEHRSTPAEAKLAEIIEDCWTYEPEDRVDIFEVVELLQNALHDEDYRLQREEDGRDYEEYEEIQEGFEWEEHEG